MTNHTSLFSFLSEKYPFMTIVQYGDTEYVGIIQNRDNTVTTLYDYTSIVDAQLKAKFIDLANEWWWNSNRKIPINIFLKSDWAVFKPYLRTLINKDVTIVHGPCTSLLELTEKKSKRKSITLVKKMP